MTSIINFIFKNWNWETISHVKQQNTDILESVNILSFCQYAQF